MSLNVCDNPESHFIVQVRELATGRVQSVECLHDLDFFLAGYTPEYRIFFKDEWEIVREPVKRARSGHIVAAIGAALILGAMAGILLDLFVH